MQTKVTVLRIAPEIRYYQMMSRTHREATESVHDAFSTKAGRYSSPLYSDPWTAQVAAVAQRTRNRVLALTIDGLTTDEALPELQAVWQKATDELQRAVDEVRNNWSTVFDLAKSALGATFEARNYPGAASWRVSCRLRVQSANVPAELDGNTCQGLKDEAEAALREELIEAQQHAIEEIKELVARVANSKRAEKTRKAGIKRIARLRRANLLADPAYDAVCSEAIRELQGGTQAGVFDVDFANPFMGGAL